MKRTRILAAALLFLVLLLIGIACTQSRTFSYQPYEGELEDGQYVPNNFQQEAAKLTEVAKGGDEAAIKAQFGKTAETCKACHKEFRKD